jgi:hypothetical protein
MVGRRFPVFAKEGIFGNGRIRNYALCIFIPVCPPAEDILTYDLCIFISVCPPTGDILTYDLCIFIPVCPPTGDIFPSLNFLYKEHKIANCSKDRHCWLSR